MSIKHFEDLPFSEIKDVIENLSHYEITEKLDGARLLFGLDDTGRFYTSRGNNRVYLVGEYEINFSTNFQRFGHVALYQSQKKLLAAGMLPGDQVEVEVLHGEYPNVVPYSKDTNYIIFLRTTAGTIDINRLEQEFTGHSLVVTLPSLQTTDGVAIQLVNETSTWQFARTPVVDYDAPLLKMLLSGQIETLNEWANKQSSVLGYKNNELLTANLSKFKTGPIRDNAKASREFTRKSLELRFLAPIKDILLTQIVRNRGSKFGPPNGWIEGVVLRHRDTGKMVKLVDKKIFGVAHEFTWRIRNSVDRSSNLERILALLDKYNKEKHALKVHIVEIGKTFTYHGEIDRRTLELFAFRISQAGEDETRRNHSSNG